MTLKEQQLILHQLNHLKTLLNQKTLRLEQTKSNLNEWSKNSNDVDVILEQCKLDLKEVEEGIKIIEKEPTKVGKMWVGIVKGLE